MDCNTTSPPIPAPTARSKAALKRRVDEVKAHLRTQMQDAAPPEVVEWRIDFAAVMLAGGFDIVIANPPYVRQEEIAPPEYKQFLLKAYAAAVGRSGLYCYFYARGLQLLRDGGMHIFVCSNSWLDVGYGARLQQYLLDNAMLDAIYESAVARQFATADINFQIFRTNGDIAGRLCTAMNSTLFQLMVGAVRVVNYGGGVLRIETYENAKMQVVLPDLLPEPDAAVFNATDWDVLTPSAARRHIDAAVYEALGLTPAERAAVQAGVTELVIKPQAPRRQPVI